MNETISMLLDKIQQKKQAFDENIFRTCSDEDIVYFQEWVSQKTSLKKQSLLDFIAFSKQANELNSNGLFVYGITKGTKYSIYDMNEIWWESDEQIEHLYLGHNDLSWLSIEIKTGDYCELCKPSGSIERRYASFDELMQYFLEISLM